MARTTLSVAPNATSVPSGDQLTPRNVSKVKLLESSNSWLATFQIWISPDRPGSPAAAANRVPSGLNRTDSIRSLIPISRPTGAPESASKRITSWKPATAIRLPTGVASIEVIAGGRV